MAYLETETGRLDPWARPRNLPMAMLFLCMSAFMGAALFIYSRIGIRYDVWWWSIAVLGAVMLLISILLFVLAGLGKQYLWWNEPGSRKEFLEGPPDRCKSDMSPSVCHGACFADDYRPRQRGYDEKCDDEAGAWHLWDTICSSTDPILSPTDPGNSGDVFLEYGTSERLVAQIPAPFGLADCRA